MARPKPKILIEIADENDKREQVLYSDAIWAITYNGMLVNLKSSGMTLKSGVIHKYKKVSFSNVGHAINLCKKLNRQFKTKDFTVVKFVEGETIYSSESE